MKTPWLSIVSLLVDCGPSAIFRGIALVIVYAIQAHSGIWSMTHIAQEISETVSPAIANGYTPSAIAKVIFALLVLTASFHASPHPVLWNPLSICIGAMFYSAPAFEHEFFKNASAAAYRGVSEVVHTYRSLIAAIALAMPFDVFCSDGGFPGDYEQAAKTLTHKAFKGWHISNIILQGIEIGY